VQLVEYILKKSVVVGYIISLILSWLQWLYAAVNTSEKSKQKFS